MVQSEALATSATVELRAELSQRFNVPFPCPMSSGRNLSGTIQLMQQMYGFTLMEKDLHQLVAREDACVINAIERDLLACIGVSDVLDRLASSQMYELAVVSSSTFPRLHASLKKSGLDKYFAQDRVFSALSSLAVPVSKPDPAIYFHACQAMGKAPSECIAIEDSVSGVVSAVSAGIQVLGYVGCFEGTEAGRMGRRLEEAGAVRVLGHWAEFWNAFENVSRLS